MPLFIYRLLLPNEIVVIYSSKKGFAMKSINLIFVGLVSFLFFCTNSTKAEFIQTCMDVQPIVVKSNCNDSLADIEIHISGGTPSFTYDWAHISGSNNPEHLFDVAPGYYCVTVTDHNGCSVSECVRITPPVDINADCNSDQFIQTFGSGIHDDMDHFDEFSFDISNLICTSVDQIYVEVTAKGNVDQLAPDVIISTNLLTDSTQIRGIDLCRCDISPCPNHRSRVYCMTLDNPSAITTINLTVPPGQNDSRFEGLTVYAVCNTGTSCTGGGSIVEPEYLYQCIDEEVVNFPVPTDSIHVSIPVAELSNDNRALCARVQFGDIDTTQSIKDVFNITGNHFYGIFNMALKSTSPSDSVIVSVIACGDAPNSCSDNCNSNSQSVVVSSIIVQYRCLNSLDISCSSNSPTCRNGSDGSIQILAYGTGPYNYVYTGPSSGNGSSGSPILIGGLTAGTYNVTITDAVGCFSSCSQKLSNPPSLQCTLLSSNGTSCHQNNGGQNTDGMIAVSASGGISPYIYEINTGITNTTGMFTGLAVGSYSISATDANACTISCSDITIDQPEELVCSISSIVVENSINSDDGAFDLTVFGGTPAYAYQVLNSENNIVSSGTINSDGGSVSFSGLDGDIYTVQLLDDNNCSSACQVDLRNVNFSIDKSIKSGPTTTGSPNEFEVIYEIIVSNIGTKDTTYNLDDTIKFGEGALIDFVSAVYDLSGENDQSGSINISFNGVTDHLIVSDESLVSGQMETWLITVIYEMDLSLLTPLNADCELDQFETGTGLLNAATIYGGVPIMSDTACTEIPEPQCTIEKSIVQNPVPTGNSNEFELSYLIEVTNVGNVLAFYDLSDTLKYGLGAVPQNITVAYDSGEGLTEVFNENFDGLLEFTILEEEPVDIGMVDRFLVTVTFFVNSDLWTLASSDCNLDVNENGTGLLNAATIDGGVPFMTDTACTSIPFTEPECLDTLIIIGPVTVYDTLEMAVLIQTNGEVIVNSNAVFNAPNIELNPGFEVPLGTEFTMLVSGCLGEGLSKPGGSKKIINASSLDATKVRKFPLPQVAH